MLVGTKLIFPDLGQQLPKFILVTIPKQVYRIIDY
jgi:hypothetical protein